MPTARPDPDSEETALLADLPPLSPPISRMGSSAPERPRFAPGSLLASRYRIISRLGKGGMGEVFRADDILLGQPVALKFLPESARGNLNLLTRFYDEVRIARQISHANVCRVYDIGEIGGQPYLSMEYIDGEDLSSLLRRIGRLPGDKAAEFARKICAGLAAAHAQGVLHRDIKPANIMIDGRGEPRITDFGLAAVAAGIESSEIRNGTPAYMAPEQLEGREVSVQSDIYAMGLVLHEMFTGKVAHGGATLAERIEKRSESTADPSTLVPDLDPAVQRAIQRCLEPDPKLRPASALELSRLLPGGDPLEAALAAGHTPSPELVAASGDQDTMRPAVALAMLSGIVMFAAIAFWLGPRYQLMNHTPLEHPEVLESKAREIVRALGYTQEPADTATGFEYSQEHRSFYMRRQLDASGWTRTLATFPSPLRFGYRQSPLPLVAEDIRSQGAITRTVPPLNVGGMVTAIVAMDGRLLTFTAVPPQKNSGTPLPADWAPLFAAAKLDPAKFTPVDPEWTPPVASDARAAWTGVYPGNDIPVRIEAAAFLGKPVYFDILWPWAVDRSTAQSDNAIAARRSNTRFAYGLLGILLALAACFIARMNWRAGRVDLRGANVLATFVAIVNLANWMLRAHHVATAAEQTLWLTALADSIAMGMMSWIVYLALEPWVRRYWPQSLIAWSRVVAGRWSDPMVGRDVLVALLLGLIYTVYIFAIMSIDGMSAGDFQVNELMGTRAVLQVMAADLGGAVSVILRYFMFMLLLRVLLKKPGLASAAFIVLWCVYLGFESGATQWWIAAAFSLPITALFVFTLVRFGFLALMATAFVLDTSVDTIMTADLTEWYGQSSLMMLLLLAGLAIWGARLALGNRLLLSPKALES